MDWFRISVITILLTTFLFSCTPTKTFHEKNRNIPAKKMENYSFLPDSPLIDRIDISSDIVLDYMKNMDKDDTYSIYKLSEVELQQFGYYLQLLPVTYKKILQERLLGIYFIENLLGSGLADSVVAGSDEIYSILILNPIVLKKSLTELLTYKENTCFNNDNENIGLEIKVSDDYLGLLYILLHESTHIVDYIKGITPFVEPDMVKLYGENKDASPFTTEYWDDYRQFKDSIPGRYRGKINFYSNMKNLKISNTEILEVYSDFSKTPFATLYSYSNWAEDLADYCTVYYLTRIMKLDYRICIYNKNEQVFTYEPFNNPLILERVDRLKLFGEI